MPGRGGDRAVHVPPQAQLTLPAARARPILRPLLLVWPGLVGLVPTFSTAPSPLLVRPRRVGGIAAPQPPGRCSPCQPLPSLRLATEAGPYGKGQAPLSHPCQHLVPSWVGRWAVGPQRDSRLIRKFKGEHARGPLCRPRGCPASPRGWCWPPATPPAEQEAVAEGQLAPRLRLLRWPV